MWVPLNSELKIGWQHPAQISNCYRINVQSTSSQVNLIRASALFAEPHFNLTVDSNGEKSNLKIFLNKFQLISGHLNVFIFDGFVPCIGYSIKITIFQFFLHSKCDI